MKSLLTLAVAAVTAATAFAVNPTAVHIQRTLDMMEKSTAENPAHVKVMFYGQSITAQAWTQQVVDKLTNTYPTVKFSFSKLAIGGFSAERLYRTALTDLYPAYPDLMIFHVYGPWDKYEEIIAQTKKLTAADIIVWSSHLGKRANLEEESKGPNDRAKHISAIAERWNCMYIDLHGQWCKMLKENNFAPSNVLADVIHLNKEGVKQFGKIIKDEIVRIPGAKGITGVSGVITEIPVDSPAVKARQDGGYDVTFTGNRLVAQFDGSATKGVDGEVLIDGNPVKSVVNSWITTRTSAWPMWQPSLLHIDFEKPLVEEDWTLTVLDGSDPEAKFVRFRVDGSVTGFDGEGWSTNRFVSKSGRVIIPPTDWGWVGQIQWQNSWNSTLNKKRAKEGQELLPLYKLEPGQTIKWKTRNILESPFGVHTPGERRLMVQGLDVGTHTLSIVPKKNAKLGIVKFVSYSPGAAAAKTEKINNTGENLSVAEAIEGGRSQTKANKSK